MATGIRKRNGGYRLRLTLASGERIEVVSSKTTLREATEERAQLILKERAKRIGTWQGSETVTVQELWDLYTKVAKRRGSWAQIESRFRMHILPVLGPKRFVHVTSADIETLLADMEEAGYSPCSRQHVRTRLVVLFNWAKRARYIAGDNPAALAERPRVPKKLPRTLPLRHIQDVIDGVRPEWRNFFAIALYTGLRSGELRGLRPEDLEENYRGFRLTRSGSNATTKTAEERFVPIPSAALPYLKAALKASEGRPWIFVDGWGEQLPKHIRPPDILREALDKMGLVKSYTVFCQTGCTLRLKGLPTRDPWRCPKCKVMGKVLPEHPLTFHDLRKTWETHLYRATKDLAGVAVLAGHDADVAAQIYLGQDQEHLHSMVATLDFRNAAPSGPHRSPVLVGTSQSGMEANGAQLMSNGADSK